MHISNAFFHAFLCKGEDCSCQAGLSCVLTKKVNELGTLSHVKQCMPQGTEIEVETIDLDNQVADEPMKMKRFLFFNVSIQSPTSDY